MQKSFVPSLAFKILKDAGIEYEEKGSFSSDTLESLHSLFDNNLTKATEMLDSAKVYQYSTLDGSRLVYKVVTSKDQHTIYDNINFCSCEDFCNNVLESRNSLSCCHVLLVHVAKITKVLVEEVVSPSRFEEFLNGHLEDNE